MMDKKEILKYFSNTKHEFYEETNESICTFPEKKVIDKVDIDPETLVHFTPSFKFLYTKEEVDSGIVPLEEQLINIMIHHIRYLIRRFPPKLIYWRALPEVYISDDFDASAKYINVLARFTFEKGDTK